MPKHTQCRICETALPEPFLDLGEMPLANAFLKEKAESKSEKRFPLAITACTKCGLVQTDFVVPAQQLYRNYLYVSSTSDAVQLHVITLAAQICSQYELGPDDLVVELGSNDGLILRSFQALGPQVLGGGAG